MKRWRKPLLRAAKLVALVFSCIILIPLAIALSRVAIECRPFSSGETAQANGSAGPNVTHMGPDHPAAGLTSYTRNEDQTYLTLPEWYIVYSSDEYAAYIADNPPSQFPYFGAIGQFWQSYYDVCAVTREQYPFNGGYHLSLVVIGTSFTVENIFKGIYENTLGRVTEWISSPELTQEDAYAREVAAEYGTFLHTIPWYEFPFGAKLNGLWTETDLWGPNIIRKAERKTALSIEYGSKALYGWVIRQGTQGVYSAEDLHIHLWVKGVSPEMMQREPDVQLVKMLDAQQAIVVMPRYEAFTQIVPRLTQQGVQFIEIAGNDDILITVLAPRAWQYDGEDGMQLFVMPILTEPERQRVAIKVPVEVLQDVLTTLDQRTIVLEHIYDY